jgi:hypothetical protein
VCSTSDRRTTGRGGLGKLWRISRTSSLRRVYDMGRDRPLTETVCLIRAFPYPDGTAKRVEPE